MTLVVEDGTGLSNANAFISQAYMDDYATSRELNDWLNGANDPEAAIIRATDALSNGYIWKGSRLKGRLQALAWPRTDVVDEEEEDVDAASVPPEVQQACAMFAAYEMANPGGLTPSVIQSTRIQMEKIGDLQIQYALGDLGPQAEVPVLTAVENILSGLIEGSPNNGINGVAQRI